MITEIEDYFAKGCGRCPRFATESCSTRTWAAGLAALRRICRDTGLAETVRWGHPCYRHADRNIVILGAFREDFRLTFFDAALLSDPAGLLEAKGQFSRVPDILRFTANEQVASREADIRAFIAQAMDNADKGRRPARSDETLDWPAELVEALDADPELAEAFHGLTPGRQKSYVIALASAKKPDTRFARIDKYRDRILAGKGALDR